MTREEMIEKLHQIHVGVSLVALTTEGALECTCVTPSGMSYEWQDMYEWDWPAYCINLPEQNKLIELQHKVKNHSLVMSDIEGTELLQLYLNCIADSIRSDDMLNSFFSNIVLMPLKDAKSAYVLLEDQVALFFDDYDLFEAKFAELWPVTPWEECSDETLEEMLEQANDFDGIPLTTFSEDE